MSISPDILLSHVDYSRHATEALLDACALLQVGELELDRKSSHGGILGTLQHIYFADRVWLSRFRGKPVAFKSEGENPPISELAIAWLPILDGFKDYVSSASEPALMEDFTYTNLAGKQITIARYKALLHVVNHATMHRGQVMTMLRQAGHVPPSSDLLYYYLH